MVDAHTSKDNRVLCICGMHRSHTSFLASWLNVSGLHMGDRLMRPELGNPLGFFEDLDFVELHESILKQNNKNSLSIELSTISISPKFISHARSIIQQKNADHHAWGWKDPRTCLFFKSMWKQELPQVHVIIIYRHFREVVNSLINRDIQFLLREINYTTFIKGNNLPTRALNFFYKLVRKKMLRYDVATHSNNYLKNWIDYNERCIEIYQTLAPGSCMILTIQDLLKEQNEVERILNSNWKFDLDYIAAKILWKPGKSKRNNLNTDPILEKQARIIMAKLSDISVSSRLTSEENYQI